MTNTHGGSRGIDNRNPFNVKQVPTKWKGSIGEDADGHAIFGHEVYSARAVMRDLADDFLNDDKRTLRGLFADYAPKAAGNDPDDYARFVAKRIGRNPDEKLRLFRPNGATNDFDSGLLLPILMAMVEMEICAGYQVPVEILNSGMALYRRDFVSQVQP